MHALARMVADLLFPPRGADARVRALSADDLRDCYKPKEIADGIALFPYAHPDIRTLIWELKYRGNAHAARLFAELLAEVLLDDVESGYFFSNEQPMRVVPVPLHPKRMRERGWNQIALVLKELPRGAHAVDLRALKRTRSTKSQTRLPKLLRTKNVRNSMEGAGIRSDTIYIVVDDVATTGATLSEAVRALHAAGAKEVRTIALAYA